MFFIDVNCQDLLLVAIEDEKYQRINGRWLIGGMKLTTHSQSHLPEGWHKAVMIKYGR